MKCPQFENGVLFLPTRTGSHIELRLEDLSECPINELLTLLKEEGISLRYWVTIGHALIQVCEDEEKILQLIIAGADEALRPTLGECDRRERMDIINLVATYYLSKFSRGSPLDDPETKEEYLRTARGYYHDAEDQRLLVTSSAWAGRAGLDVAWYLLHKQDDTTYLDCAGQYYETARVLAKEPLKVDDLQQAYIGLGLVRYLKKDWKGAARNYQQVFRHGPASTNILFSLALCYHKLNEKDKVQQIITRILNHDPDHLGSLCAMARGIAKPTHEISDRFGFSSSMEDANSNVSVRWLTKAVEAHPGNPLATVLLCDDLISTSGANSELEDILTDALALCTDRNLHSEIHYQLGRMKHKDSEKKTEDGQVTHKEPKLKEAEEHFRQCIDIYNGKHHSAMYSLAQILGTQGKITEATTILEDVKDAHPNDYDVTKLLSVLYVDQGEYEKALDCVNKCVMLQRTVKERGDDVNLWILQARCLLALQNKGDVYVEAAIKAYERLLDHIAHRKPGEPGEELDQCVIWNNIGTLKFKDKNLGGALEAYQKALEIVEAKAERGEETASLRATLIFNLACVHEDKGDFQTAQERYNFLLGSFPWFQEPRSRLGSIDLRQRNPTSALSHLEASSSQSFTNVLLTSEAYRQQGHYEKARSVVAQALKEREKDFSSVEAAEALVYLGTLHYEMALLLCPYKRAPQRDQHFQRAFQLFTKAFECHEEGQPLAANGMAMVFAQKKEFNKAHRLFSKVLQSNESAHVKMNLGHTYMRGGATKVNPGAAPNPLDARKALRLYEAAWQENSFVDETEKFHVATSMALAHIVAKDFSKGIKVLEESKEANPGNQQLVYNLSISKHGRASKCLKNTEERAKPEKVNEAVELLKQAKAGFESVVEAFLKSRQTGRVPIGFEDLQKLEMKRVVGICRGRLTHCEDSIEQCTEWLKRQSDSVIQIEAKQRLDRENQLRLMREEEQNLEEQQRKANEEAERKRVEAEELAESLMEVALGMQLPRETDKDGPVVKKKDKPDLEVDEEEEDMDMDAPPEGDMNANGEDAANAPAPKGPKPKPKGGLTEDEKEERRRRKDEKRLARMTPEEKERYIQEKEDTRKKRLAKVAEKAKKKGKKNVEGAGAEGEAAGGEGEGAGGEPQSDGEEAKDGENEEEGAAVDVDEEAKEDQEAEKPKKKKGSKKRKLEKRNIATKEEQGDAPATGSGDAPATGSRDAPATGSGDAPATGSGDIPASVDESAAKRPKVEDGQEEGEVIVEAMPVPKIEDPAIIQKDVEDVLGDLFPEDEEMDIFEETDVANAETQRVADQAVAPALEVQEEQEEAAMLDDLFGIGEADAAEENTADEPPLMPE